MRPGQLLATQLLITVMETLRVLRQPMVLTQVAEPFTTFWALIR